MEILAGYIHMEIRHQQKIANFIVLYILIVLSLSGWTTMPLASTGIDVLFTIKPVKGILKKRKIVSLEMPVFVAVNGLLLYYYFLKDISLSCNTSPTSYLRPVINIYTMGNFYFQR